MSDFIEQSPMNGLIKQAKGVFIFFGFFAFAVSIIGEPDIDVQAQLIEHWINPQMFAALFLVCGSTGLIFGLRGWKWNGMIFAPYFAFMGFAIEAAIENPQISGSTATAYILLGIFILADFVLDHNYIGQLRVWVTKSWEKQPA